MAEKSTALAVAALVLLAGCSNDPTRVVVVVDSDLEIPRDLDGVRFVIDARGIGGDVATREVALESAPLPLVLPVVHEGGPLGPVDIEAQGMRRGARVVARAARLAFAPSRSLALHLVLASRCVARDCGADETCADGACVPREVDSASLPLWSDGARDGGAVWVDDAGLPPPVDASAGDAGPTDAGTPDAPTCAAGCSCEQTCSRACTCGSGCACALSCPSGGDCQDVRCDRSECVVDAVGASNLRVRCEREARCTIDARGVSNALPLECRDGTTCDVDCTGTSNCEVRCDGRASCLVRCDGEWGDDCKLSCGGTLTMCGDTVAACNRDCP